MIRIAISFRINHALIRGVTLAWLLSACLRVSLSRSTAQPATSGSKELLQAGSISEFLVKSYRNHVPRNVTGTRIEFA